MKLFKFAAVAAVFFLPASAQAGVLSSLLTFNGTEDLLIDQSRSSLFDADSSGGFSLGDVLYGYVSIDQVDADNDGLDVQDISPDAVVFAFAAKITGANLNGSINLGASDVAGYTLGDLLDADVYSNVTNASETIFVGLEGTPVANVLDESTFDSLDDFNAGNGLSYILSGGIAGGSDDFFHFRAAPPGFGFIGAEAGGFTIFDHGFGSGTTFVDVDSGRLDGLADTQHNISLLNGFISEASSGSVWDFTNNSDFLVNAVPEPSSLLAFAGVFGLGLMRRRRS